MTDGRMRTVLALQWIGTLVVLALPITNAAIALVLPVWWWATFDGLSRRELAVFAGAAVLFTTMDAVAVAHGVFTFDDPDVLGVPVWEPLMFGFYLVHTHRILGGPPVRGSIVGPLAFALAFAGPFLVPLAWLGHTGLFALATGVLALGLLAFRGRWDLAYAGYMLALGWMLEHVGTAANKWHYDGTGGAVPLWSATMFAGIGLALRRLLSRWLVPIDSTLDRRKERFDVASRLDGRARGPRASAHRSSSGADERDERPRQRRGLSRAGSR